MVALDESLPGAPHAADRERSDAYFAKYERSLRETPGSSPEEMAAALSTALRITPGRWRLTP